MDAAIILWNRGSPLIPILLLLLCDVGCHVTTRCKDGHKETFATVIFDRSTIYFCRMDPMTLVEKILQRPVLSMSFKPRERTGLGLTVKLFFSTHQHHAHLNASSQRKVYVYPRVRDIQLNVFTAGITVIFPKVKKKVDGSFRCQICYDNPSSQVGKITKKPVSHGLTLPTTFTDGEGEAQVQWTTQSKNWTLKRYSYRENASDPSWENLLMDQAVNTTDGGKFSSAISANKLTLNISQPLCSHDNGLYVLTHDDGREESTLLVGEANLKPLELAGYKETDATSPESVVFLFQTLGPPSQNYDWELSVDQCNGSITRTIEKDYDPRGSYWTCPRWKYMVWVFVPKTFIESDVCSIQIDFQLTSLYGQDMRTNYQHQLKALSTTQVSMEACDKPLKSGFFCDEFCNHQRCDKCNRSDPSECLSCIAGFRSNESSVCTTACTDGTWGNDCLQQCDQSCSDTCDSISGACPRECERGTYGEYCIPCPEACSYSCDSLGRCTTGNISSITVREIATFLLVTLLLSVTLNVCLYSLLIKKRGHGNDFTNPETVTLPNIKIEGDREGCTIDYLDHDFFKGAGNKVTLIRLQESPSQSPFQRVVSALSLRHARSGTSAINDSSHRSSRVTMDTFDDALGEAGSMVFEYRGESMSGDDLLQDRTSRPRTSPKENDKSAAPITTPVSPPSTASTIIE